MSATTSAPTRAEVERAIGEMEFHRRTHEDWARYFEAHPEEERAHVATGDWDDAAEHRRIVERYDRVIALLRHLLGTCAP